MILCILLLLILLHSLTAKTWHIKTVDSVGPQSGYPSLAIDSKGNPHMCYNDFVNLSNYNMKYATLIGSNWSIETIQSSGICLNPRISLDSKDNPYIVYTEYRNSTYFTELATLTGCNWTIKTIDNTNLLPKLIPSFNGTMDLTFLNLTSIDRNIVSGSIEFGSKGNPQIAFVNGSQTYGGNLIYAEYLDSQWHTQIIDSNISSVTPCLVLDAEDNPHIAYIDRTSSTLRYAEWTGSEWKIQVREQYSGQPSMTLDANGNTHVSYETDEGLMYAVVSGSHWNVQRVDINRSTSFPQLVLDYAGNPRIACHQSFYHGHGTTTYAVAYASLASAVEMQPELFSIIGLAFFALIIISALFIRAIKNIHIGG